MSATRKISEAENILTKISLSEGGFRPEFENFVKTIHDVFLHLLDEYNVKFDLKIDRIGLEKFKTVAKKTGKINAINFLIWYEKEYKKLRNDPEVGIFLEKEFSIPENHTKALELGAILLEKTKNLTYYAYENF